MFILGRGGVTNALKSAQNMSAFFLPINIWNAIGALSKRRYALERQQLYSIISMFESRLHKTSRQFSYALS